MPKFIVTVIHSGQTGRITIDAPSGDAARERAIFDGYKVTDVALAMPEPTPVAPTKSLPNRKPSFGIQFLCVFILGLPGLGGLVSLAFSTNPVTQLMGLPVVALVGIAYWGICKPNRYARLWSTVWGLSTCVFVLMLPNAIRRIYLVATSDQGMSPELVAHFALQAIGVGLFVLIAFSRMKETP